MCQSVPPLFEYCTTYSHTGAIGFIGAYGEVQPVECKVFTGCLINTCRVLVSLPFGNLSAWSQSIKTILEHSFSFQCGLAKLVGLLNHTCFIIPNARHCISHICHFTNDLPSSRRCVTILLPIMSLLNESSVCLKFHILGLCSSNYPCDLTHVPLTSDVSTQMSEFVKTCCDSALSPIPGGATGSISPPSPEI